MSKVFGQPFVLYSPNDGAGGGSGDSGAASASAPAAVDAGAASGGAPAAFNAFEVPNFAFDSLPTEIPSAPAVDPGDKAPIYDTSQLDKPDANAPGTPSDPNAPPKPDDATKPSEAPQETKPTETPATTDEKPTEAPAAKEGDPSAPATDVKPVEFTPEAAKLLQDTALLLGIKETDPAKIPDAIKAHQEVLAQQAEESRITQETQADEAVYAKLRQESDAAVKSLASDSIDQAAKDILRSEGHNVDIEKWWERGTWEDPNYGPQLEARFNELRASLEEQLPSDPRFQRAFETDFAARKSVYDGQKESIAKLATEFPMHNPDLLAEFRRANPNVSIDHLKRMAEITHNHTAKASSTLNTELTGAKAALAAAQAQIAEFPKLLEAAKLEGKQAAVSTLSEPNPASNGLGSSAPVERKWNPANSDPGFGWDSIPSS